MVRALTQHPPDPNQPEDHQISRQEERRATGSLFLPCLPHISWRPEEAGESEPASHGSPRRGRGSVVGVGALPRGAPCRLLPRVIRRLRVLARLTACAGTGSGTASAGP